MTNIINILLLYLVVLGDQVALFLYLMSHDDFIKWFDRSNIANL